MLLTHLSHLDIEDRGGNVNYRLFNGTKIGCLRLARCHGLETVSRKEGEIEFTQNSIMWQRKDGSWDLWIPRKVWENE
jgi:hypothetical protein